jgi:hypothetical protein
MVRDADWATLEDRREAVAALLETAAASMNMPHPPEVTAAAGAPDLAAASVSAAGAQPTPNTAVIYGSVAADRKEGHERKWAAAVRSLREAWGDLKQQQQEQQQQAGQGPTQGVGMQSMMRVVRMLTKRDEMDALARFFLACVEVSRC